MKYWDYIKEHEINDEWRQDLSDEYKEYRESFELALNGEYDNNFPLSIEIESSYYCNLKCPLCPRVAGENEKNDAHMSMDLFKKIVEESREKGLKAILMDHEAESLMNPRFMEMLRIAKDAGIIDIWLHTNATLLNRKISENLIDNGITKINFSIDAVTKETYDIVRKGGNYDKCLRNVKEFLSIKKEKKAKHVRTRVSFVVSEINRHEKRAFFDYWKNEPELNLITFQDAFDFLPFESPDEDSKLSSHQLDEKYSDRRPFFCSQPWESPVIDVSGNVSPCGAPVRFHNNDFFLGNLNKGDTIESCYDGEKMHELRNLHRNNQWYKNSMCRVCVNSKELRDYPS